MKTTSTTVRLSLLGIVLLLAAAATAWAVASDRGGGDSAAVDPHAGHDMGGISVAQDGTVSIAADAARSLGIVVAAAELGEVSRSLRSTGYVTYDETRLSTITPKFGGFIERLHVDNTGQLVRRGQPVLEIYSPDLVAAQEELLTALRLEAQLSSSAAPGVITRTAGLAESARRKLQLWDISPSQIRRLEETGQVRRTLTLHAATAGFVVEKMVQSGQAVDAGMPLYRLADLSRVWVEADVYEQDLRFVRVNDSVRLDLAAYPGEAFTGRVAYIHPDVRPDTRSTRIRVVLDNPGGRIKPGMFATVHIEMPVTGRAVLVPRDAVMRTGTRNLVFVEVGAGTYEPRVVQIGESTGDRIHVLSGLLAGERVVGRANFLLDAESRLMESMGGMSDMPGHAH